VATVNNRTEESKLATHITLEHLRLDNPTPKL